MRWLKEVMNGPSKKLGRAKKIFPEKKLRTKIF